MGNVSATATRTPFCFCPTDSGSCLCLYSSHFGSKDWVRDGGLINLFKQTIAGLNNFFGDKALVRVGLL